MEVQGSKLLRNNHFIKNKTKKSPKRFDDNLLNINTLDCFFLLCAKKIRYEKYTKIQIEIGK